MSQELTQLTIQQAHKKLKNKEVSSVELTQAFLDRIAKIDSKIQSYVSVANDLALEQAKKADQIIQAGNDVLPLTGIPIAPKDIYLTQGIETTCSSNILKGFMPPYNSTVIEKCLAQNCVILGKVNLDEFAMGSSCENSAIQKTKNPWDINRVPGGSSGGSSAAVSADLCVASLGTDTGGSIRQPASHCSIVGLKPTYGRVSRFGTIAFASSLDQMGPMTKTVEDAALLLQVMAGHDKSDSTSINRSVPNYSEALKKDIKGLKVGVPKEYFVEGMSPEVEKTVKAALDQLKSLGAEIIEVSLPNTQYAVATYYIIAPAEASANLARYDGVRFGLREQGNSLAQMYENTKGKGFGKEVKRRIMIGTYVLSSGYYDAYYIKAQKARTVIRQDFFDVFDKVDVIAGPVAPTTAFELGSMESDPLQMYLSDILTIPVNLAGLPGMSVPCGFSDSDKMPIGLQLIGKPFDEETLLRVGYNFEQATDISKKRPIL